MDSNGLNRILRVLATLLLLSFLVTGCGKSNDYGSNPGGGTPPPGNTPSHLVTMANFTFSPSSMTVAVGDTVTWRNDDNVGHTVTSDTGTELNSPLLGNGQSYQHVFGTAGTFPYHCSVHTTMTGTIIVQ